MLEKYATYKLIRIFIEDPYTELYLREIAQRTGQSTNTVRYVTDDLVKMKLLLRRKQANIVLFRANIENPVFRYLKISYSLGKIQKLRLVEYLVEKYTPESIVLFGGVSRGEDDPHSDIDLLIISKIKSHIDISKFEDKFSKKINMIVYSPAEWSEKAKKDRPFYQRIYREGILLYGEFPVV